MCSKCDPVVQRVRAAGRAIQERCGGDLHAFFEWARNIQAEFPERVVGYEEPARRRLHHGGTENTENDA